MLKCSSAKKNNVQRLSDCERNVNEFSSYYILQFHSQSHFVLLIQLIQKCTISTRSLEIHWLWLRLLTSTASRSRSASLWWLLSVCNRFFDRRKAIIQGDCGRVVHYISFCLISCQAFSILLLIVHLRCGIFLQFFSDLWRRRNDAINTNIRKCVIWRKF